MLLEALQNFEWYNEPENVVFQEKNLCVSARPETDFWQSKQHGIGRDNGHFFFTRRKGDFVFAIKWTLKEISPFHQCGIMLRIDENNWIKATILYDNPKRPMVGTSVTQSGYSDWAAQDISPDTSEIWFKLKRIKEDYLIYYSLDGKNYTQMRITHMLNDLSEIKVGAFICNPTKQPFEATLSQLEFI